MRIWSIHPRYLDWKGLGALWRETLLAQRVLLGGTRGWRNHPQLDRFKGHVEPLKAVGFYLVEVHRESRRRGYRYDFSKILEPVDAVEHVRLTWGQLEYEYRILNERLARRDPAKLEENQKAETLEPHPMFRVVEGPPEPWEKSYWRDAKNS
ncbi:MAG: pyrimidine dimer DNA glycosylase/endonuclease V [Candidatus Bathyarchaeota archaeon]